MIEPMRIDLTMRRNDNAFRAAFAATSEATGADYDFTGHIARLEIRMRPGQAGAAKLSATSAASSGTRLAVTAGGIEFVATKSAIGSLPANPATGADLVLWYDLLVTPPGGDENAWFEGQVFLKAGVTA